MYANLLILHSIFRWLVLLTLLFSLVRAAVGYYKQQPFSTADNALRHWTATTAHIQLVLGTFLYIKSPLIPYFWSAPAEAIRVLEAAFFGVFHIAMMLFSVVVVTIGSALAKRKTDHRDKYKTMLVWFGLSLMLIFIAIPWHFSPFVARPLFRFF